MVQLKTCIVCKIDLPMTAEYFAQRKKSTSGFCSECKSCKREYDKAYRKKNKAKLAEKSREYAVKNKEKNSLRYAEWKRNNPEKIAEWKKQNKEKIIAYNKKYWQENKDYAKEQIGKWREENADRIKEYRKINRERDRERERTWYKTPRGNSISRTITNRRRALKKRLPNNFTSDDWNKCQEYFEWCCAYCGSNEYLLEQEHVLALSKGGGLVSSNIVPACRVCNASKSAKDFIAWYRSYEKYSCEREILIMDYLSNVEAREKEGAVNG